MELQNEIDICLSNPPYSVRINTNPATSEDISQSIQRAVDSVSLSTELDNNSGAIIRIPAGVYKLNMPIRVDSSNISITGAGDSSTRLDVIMRGGDVFCIGTKLHLYEKDQVKSAFPIVETENQITSDESYALNLFDGSKHNFVNYWINATSSGLYFDGWNELCFEFFFLFNEYPHNSGTLIRCAGQRFDYEEVDETLCVRFDQNGDLFVRIKIGTDFHELATTAPLKSLTPYHIAVDYDGAHLRLFVSGRMHQERAATGVINQNEHEDCTIGTSFKRWPEGSIETNPPSWAPNTPAKYCLVSGIRFDSKSFYVSDFDPPTSSRRVSRIVGGQWLLHMSNSTFHSNEIFKVFVPSGLAYAWIRQGGKNWKEFGSPRRRSISNVSTSNLWFTSSKGFVRSAVTAIRAIRLKCTQLRVHGMTAVHATNNCFYSKFEDIRCVIGQSHNRPGFILANASGITQISDLDIQGGKYCLTIRNCGVSIFHVSLYSQNPRAYLLMMDSADVNIEGLTISDENENTVPESGVLFESGASGFSRIKGLLELGKAIGNDGHAYPEKNPFTVYPPIKYSSGEYVGSLFFEGSMMLHPSQQYCFHLVHAANTPVFKAMVFQRGTQKDLANVAGSVVEL